MTRQTVGALSTKLIERADDRHTVIDQMQESLTDYDRELFACAERGKREYHTDYYLVVITKKERLMRNVLRSYFLHRRSCPTPQYDEAVYKVDRSNDTIEFLWVIPAKDVCQYLSDNSLTIANEERQLLNFVLSFNDGSLLARAKQLNGENSLQ